MPESVEAARKAVVQMVGEGIEPTKINIYLYAFQAARAEERNRLLNPSGELVEAAAKAIHHARFPRATHGEVYPASRAWARAALQAAAKEIEGAKA